MSIKDYKPKFPDLGIVERNELLRANSDKIEAINYNRFFEEEEIRNMQVNLSELSVEMSNLDLELERVADPIKEKIKAIQKKLDNLISFLRDGYENITADCYKFVEHENNEVVYYDTKGYPVKTRGILPEEKQMTFQSQVRSDLSKRRAVNE